MILGENMKPAWAAKIPTIVGSSITDLQFYHRYDNSFPARCESCHDEKLVAFSCKKRGFCPSCGARRMANSTALLVDEVWCRWYPNRK